ncbi:MULTISPECIES: hypothetical protein [Streptomyces]|uniref:Uncharacterized protein n=1 Tax=Streptomyces sp. NBC_00093 TaxID=2975649 RepID=A0AAU2A192_9ACTN
MRLFRRSPVDETALPPDIVHRMGLYGRWEFDRSGSGPDIDVPALIYVPLHPPASADPGGFVERLADAVLPVGGWAAYGGSHCVRDLLAQSQNEHPRYLDMLDTALDFLHGRGVPSALLNGYEWSRWCATHGGGNW